MLARLLSLLILAFGCPTSARCPPTMDLRTGIRRSGVYACWPHPVAPRGWSVARLGPITDWDGTYRRPERSVQPDGVLTGRIWCVRGVPIVVDDRTVSCQHDRR